MKLFYSLLVANLLGFCHYVAAVKAVFAHFMLDNTDGWSQTMWETEMSLAITANIDAFALNIAAGSALNPLQIPNAFMAANAKNFKLFFSFDYAGGGAWLKADVLALLNSYILNGAYFLHDGAQPLVSTFEGPDNAADWVEIKKTTGCFFIPDWSSLGAAPALAKEAGVVDGLFSWAAWPYGGLAMDTYTDASYIADLSVPGKPYMMAASPWFYTNLPGFTKNWMWPTETMSLWADRWNEILFLQPDYVEIISWNDFGESHYIGPTHDSPPFSEGKDKFDYVTGIDHDALRWPLGIWAQQYKNDVATITEESLVLSYLLHDITCDDGDTVINTASQEQIEFFPNTVLSYRYIGYMATLGSAATLTITVGGKAMAASWVHTPADGVGVYYGYIYLEDGVSGDVSAVLNRDGAAIISVTGEAIGGCTDEGYANFNLYTTGDFAAGKISAKTTPISDLVCTSGTGATGFEEICSTSCSLGYCPPGACVCTGIGKQPKLPVATGTAGYAKSDTDYIGLCNFLYNYGYTFPNYCSTTEQTISTPAVSAFLPSACTAGTGLAEWEEYGVDGLCSWLCSYGYCPIRICECTATGALKPLANVVVPDDIDTVVYPVEDNLTLDNMCTFACAFGVCVCEEDGSSDPLCDWKLTFTSLEQLATFSHFYNQTCNEIYALQVLLDDISTALVDYNDISDGYDKLFGYYVTYIKDLVQPSIDEFMAADGWKYFECTWTTNAGSSEGQACPDPSDIDSDNHLLVEGITIDWVFTNETGFWAVLNDQYGIPQDWVKLGSAQPATGCIPKGVSCVGAVCTTSEPCHATYMNWHDYPMQGDDIVVPNPQDIFTQSGSAITDLPAYIEATLMDVMLGNWEGSIMNPVQVIATPVALAQQAIGAMQEVKKLGAAEEKAEKQAIIGWIITAVLALVPFVGEEVAAGAGLATLARGIAIAGEAANAGYDIYSMVKDPTSSAMTLLGMLGGIGGVVRSARTVDGMGDMAAVRRSMSSDIGKMGTTVSNQATYLQKVVRSCDL